MGIAPVRSIHRVAQHDGPLSFFLLCADHHVIAVLRGLQNLRVAEMTGKSRWCFQDHTRFFKMPAVLTDGQTLMAAPELSILVASGVIEIQPLADHHRTAGMHPGMVVRFFRQKSASLKLPAHKIPGGEKTPFLMRMIFSETVPLKKHIVFSPEPAQTVGIVHQPLRWFQMVGLPLTNRHILCLLCFSRCCFSVVLLDHIFPVPSITFSKTNMEKTHSLWYPVRREVQRYAGIQGDGSFSALQKQFGFYIFTAPDMKPAVHRRDTARGCALTMSFILCWPGGGRCRSMSKRFLFTREMLF